MDAERSGPGEAGGSAVDERPVPVDVTRGRIDPLSWASGGGLRATTPGGHPLINTAWLIAVLVLAFAALALIRRLPIVLPLLVIGLVLFLLGYIAYMTRHAVFVRSIDRADRALRAGDLRSAREIASPLLDRYPETALVQKIAAQILYAAGDPMSAAALFERAAQALGGDREVVVGLVAAYAALNKGGDARRASALTPDDLDVRLALSWSELVALGGDRARGAALAHEVHAELADRGSPARLAMAGALTAIAFAQHDRAEEAIERLRAAEARHDSLDAADRAFIGYLGGVALRELGRRADAIATFEGAMAAAPDTIGEALARRERANLISA